MNMKKPYHNKWVEAEDYVHDKKEEEYHMSESAKNDEEVCETDLDVPVESDNFDQYKEPETSEV